MGKYHYNRFGMPIHIGLAPGMNLCEELHLTGNGCKYDGICQSDDYEKDCLLKQEQNNED